jgi:hypothetical protein
MVPAKFNLFEKVTYLRGELCLPNRFIWCNQPNEIYFYPDISTSESSIKVNIYFVVFVILVFPFQYFIRTQTDGRLYKTLKGTQQKRSKEAKVAVRRICYFRRIHSALRHYSRRCSPIDTEWQFTTPLHGAPLYACFISVRKAYVCVMLIYCN